VPLESVDQQQGIGIDIQVDITIKKLDDHSLFLNVLNLNQIVGKRTEQRCIIEEFRKMVDCISSWTDASASYRSRSSKALYSE